MVVASGGDQGGVRVITVAVRTLRSGDMVGGEAVGVEGYRKAEVQRRGA